MKAQAKIAVEGSQDLPVSSGLATRASIRHMDFQRSEGSNTGLSPALRVYPAASDHQGSRSDHLAVDDFGQNKMAKPTGSRPSRLAAEERQLEQQREGDPAQNARA